MNGDRPVLTENAVHYFTERNYGRRSWELQAVWDLDYGHCDQRSEESETSSVVTVTREASSLRPLVWSLWPEERAVWDKKI